MISITVGTWNKKIKIKGLYIPYYFFIMNYAVYLGAIGATEILDIIIEVLLQVFVGLTINFGMVTADGRIIQLNVILRIAPNADLILIQFVGTECYRFVFQ